MQANGLRLTAYGQSRCPCLEPSAPSRQSLAVSREPPCTSNSTPRPRFRFSTAHHCRRRSSRARPSWGIPAVVASRSRRPPTAHPQVLPAAAKDGRISKAHRFGAELTVQAVWRRGLKARPPASNLPTSNPFRLHTRLQAPSLQASKPWTLPVLVSSSEGYRNLCRLLTRAKLRAPKGESLLTLEDLDGQDEGGLIALRGRPALDTERARRRRARRSARRNLRPRQRVWIELQRHLRRDEPGVIDSLLDLAAAFRVPVMASNGVRFEAPAARPLYDVLTCLRHKTVLEKSGTLVAPNAERYLKSPAVMARLFSDLPQALAGTEALAERLEFTLANLGYRFPDYPVPAGESLVVSFLRHASRRSARADRYRPYPRPRAGADRARAAQPHREARPRRLLSSSSGTRQPLCRRQQTSRAGARIRGQQCGLLRARDHGRRSHRHGSAVRAFPLRRTRRMAGHRSRLA